VSVDTVVEFMLCAETYADHDVSSTCTQTKYLVLETLPLEVIEGRYPVFHQDTLATFFESLLKKLLAVFSDPEQEFSLTRVYPAFMALRRSGEPFWYRVVSSVPVQESDIPTKGPVVSTLVDHYPKTYVDLYFNTDGDRISGTPDKFMLSIGAV
jgi:hypothetical protein